MPATAEERFALFDHVTGMITRIATGGLVIVLDDLHWADPASLLLFTHLARNAANAPLLLVGAFRAPELRHTPAGVHTLAELTRSADTSRVALSGLSIDEAAQQLSAITGRSHDPGDVATVAARTAGNPLFVREIARLQHTSPKTPFTDLPTGVRDAIHEHLRAVSPSSLAILTTASVLGTDIDPSSLAAASASPIEDVLRALDEALAAAVVRPATDHTATDSRTTWSARACCWTRYPANAPVSIFAPRNTSRRSPAPATCIGSHTTGSPRSPLVIRQRPSGPPPKPPPSR